MGFTAGFPEKSMGLDEVGFRRSKLVQEGSRRAEVPQQRGEIAFARGVRSQEETFPLGVDTYELIGRGIRSGYSYEELQAMLTPIFEEVIEPVLVPPVRLEMFRLPERETAVIEAITGKTTLAKLLAERTSAGTSDPEEVLRAAFLGLACEL